MTKDLTDKVVLVTGASRGIGYAAALEAGRRGAHVVAVARTVGGLEELDDAIRAAGSAATLVPLDLNDGAGIDRLGQALFGRWGRLDGLIGNAGILGAITPLAHADPKVFERVFAINVTANYRLLRSLDLPLRQAPAGRAVFVSASSARSARPFWGMYAASKAALEAMVKSYAAEVAPTPLKVNVFYPGAVRTAMRAQAVPGEDPLTLPTPDTLAPRLVDMVTSGYAETRMLYDHEKDALSAL
jgi:NAD(P)-dependent dehydrogenase (short-subunit alcohol dehydrogenase family)